MRKNEGLTQQSPSLKAQMAFSVHRPSSVSEQHHSYAHKTVVEM